MTGRRLYSNGLALAQIWLWFIGMLVLTLPWHLLGVDGQPRRISSTPYDASLVAQWLPNEVAMIVGGAILMVSAILLIYVLAKTHGNAEEETNTRVEYAEALHPVVRIPPLLNGFGFWTFLIVMYLIVSYGYPIAQFFLMDTYGTTPWSI
jgi:cytochrome c oxidase subunit 1